ncbi:MAG: molybdopterin molybdotransferase MoeA [Hyphomicrobiaceae bacterium]
MTVLRDDCFLHDAAGEERISHGEAVAHLAAGVTPLERTEIIALSALVGRVLGEAIDAASPVPAHTNSAVDGFAFCAADHAARGYAPLIVAGRSAAGHPMATGLAAGTAARILTGAVMPDGADTVAMQEDCTPDLAVSPPTVTIPRGLKRGANVRRAGEDLAAGDHVFGRGHVVRAQDIAALASIGRATATCFARPRVAIVSTGDEVVRPDPASPLGRLPTGHVYDANAPMLVALARSAGAIVEDLGIWPDDRAEVTRRLARAAAEFDIVLTSGGASRGEEDHIAAALASLGRRHFWQINVKPGRPLMLGQIGDAIVAGLPGNPVAVFVCYLLYVGPLIRCRGGAPWREPRRYSLPSAFDFEGRKKGRREFWRGILVDTPSGLAVDKFRRDGSGLITGLRVADGLIDIPEDHGDVARGDPVGFIPFSEFGIGAC